METPNKILEILLKVIQSGELTINEEQHKSVRLFEKCRTQDLGRQVHQCPHCQTQVICYNPCNKRGCPSCFLKNQLSWLYRSLPRVLPTEHIHLVFSIPQRYTLEWLNNKKDIIRDLFRSVDSTLKDLEKSTGLSLGRVLVFHSHCQGLGYKPHIHCVLTNGGLDSEQRWKPLGPLPLQKMKEYFEKRFKKIRKESLTNKDTGTWEVFARKHEKSSKAIFNYLAQSVNAVHIQIDSQFEKVHKDMLRISDKKSGESRYTEMEEVTFAKRYLNHIPPERTVIIRYYGLYANRQTDKLEQAKNQLGIKPVEPKEQNVPLCPNCHEKMILVLVEWKKNNKTIDKYRPPDQRAAI